MKKFLIFYIYLLCGNLLFGINIVENNELDASISSRILDLELEIAKLKIEQEKNNSKIEIKREEFYILKNSLESKIKITEDNLTFWYKKSEDLNEDFKAKILSDNNRTLFEIQRDNDHSLWIIGIILAGLGVISPFLLNFTHTRRIKRIEANVEEKLKKVSEAEKIIKELKPEYEKILEHSRELSNQATKLKESLDNALKENDAKKQMALYDEIIEKYPDNSSAYNNRGVLKDSLGDLNGAVSDFSKVIELESDNSMAYANRGNSYYKLGKNRESRSDFDKAIKLDPTNYMAYSNRGNLKDSLKDFNGAIDDFNKSIKLNPLNSKGYSNRGATRIKMKLPYKAILDFDKAIELDPKYILAYINRASAKHNIKKDDEALLDLDKALELDPNNPVAINLRNFILSKKEKDISYFLEEVLSNSKESGDFINKFCSANDFDEFERGTEKELEEITKHIETNPNEYSLYSTRAFMYRILSERKTNDKKDELIKLAEADEQKAKELKSKSNDA